MKKILLSLSLLLLCSFYKADAQSSFGVEYDTVYYTYSGNNTVNVEDSITILSNPVTLKWNVVGTNVPSDWMPGIGICDNLECYNFSGLWPSGILRTSNQYSSTSSDFHAQISLVGATSYGTYYVVVRMYNSNFPTDTAREVYAISYWPTGVPNINSNSNVTLYPNPAANSVNVVYSTAADVKVVAVYNMIGKMMLVNKVSGNSANINIENMPAGVYFMRLVNGDGGVVATRKFTKQ